MGYIDIQNRENVDKNICDALSGYYQTGVSISKSYVPGCFILCPRLNSAVYDKPSKAVKNAVRTGHAIHGNLPKKAVMDAFISVAFSRNGLFGCKYITFETMPPHCEDILIMPGNRKVKVFDYHSGVITNIQKPMFSADGFEKEKSIRTTGIFPFVLPMELADGYTYREKLLDGCSLDRLPQSRAEKANARVEAILFELQSVEREQIGASAYTDRLKHRIMESVGCLACDEAVKNRLISFIDAFRGSTGDTVITAKSHGDLQNGNIYITKEDDVYLLDWETVDQRSLGYDILTYFYKFRYRTDYLSRIDAYLADEKWTALSEKYYGEQADRKQVLAVYLLEDLLWLAEESAATSEKKPSDGLMKYASEDFRQALTDRLKGH